MTQDEQGERLSRITTHWTLVDAAHHAPEDEGAAASARRELMRRYGGAAYRYLLGALKSPEAAEELLQDFSLRFIRGDFRRADPSRGRFRFFLKASLSHLIVDYRKRQRRRPLPLIADGPEAPDPERDFEQDWRDELLARTWEALAADESRGDRNYYTVLRLRADHPEMPSHRLAERLEAQLGRPMTAAGVRQILHRARERFGELLLDVVARSLDGPDPERLEDELIELRLLVYCRPALRRRGGVG